MKWESWKDGKQTVLHYLISTSIDNFDGSLGNSMYGSGGGNKIS